LLSFAPVALIPATTAQAELRLLGSHIAVSQSLTFGSPTCSRKCGNEWTI